MARRSARHEKPAKPKAAQQPATAVPPDASDRDKAIRALMALLAEHPWIEIDLTDIAAQANLSLAQLRAEFGSPLAILAAYIKSVDEAVLEGSDTGGEDDEETPRERLFDVLMRRLDILAPDKDAIDTLMHSARRNPPLALALNSLAVQSQRWMLTAAGIKTNGPKGMIRAQGLALMFAQVLTVWLEDDDPGLDRTMAALDRGLTSGQRWSGFLDDLMCIPAGLARARRRRRHRHHRRWNDDGDAEAVPI
jgi:AcrR family transcriptional regulator